MTCYLSLRYNSYTEILWGSNELSKYVFDSQFVPIHPGPDLFSTKKYEGPGYKNIRITAGIRRITARI